MRKIILAIGAVACLSGIARAQDTVVSITIPKGHTYHVYAYTYPTNTYTYPAYTYTYPVITYSYPTYAYTYPVYTYTYPVIYSVR